MTDQTQLITRKQNNFNKICFCFIIKIAIFIFPFLGKGARFVQDSQKGVQ